MEKRSRLIRGGLGLWALVTLMLSVSLFLEHANNGALREKVQLLERLDTLTQKHCEGVLRVNEVCESQFVELAQRLGLNNDMLPLVTTALWKRATHGEHIDSARAKLMAKRGGSGVLERSQVEQEAIGGPGPGDDGDGTWRAKKRAKAK